MVRWVKRGLQASLDSAGRVLAPTSRVLVRIFILPVYRSIVMLRLRIHRLALPARGFVLFLITNRYLLHGAVGCLAAVIIFGNLQAKQAHAQDVGRQSLLFAMATDQQSEIIEETVHPETLVPNTNYLGSATLMGIPHVDFDYDENLDRVLPSLVVPGTIAAQPFETTNGTPHAPRTKPENYIVKDNDTIGTIAQRFGVNVGTILWNNNLTERQYIRPGDALKIPPVSGLLVTIKKGDTLGGLAGKYDADAGEIASFNNIAPTDQLALGIELMLPGGRPPELAQIQTQIVGRNQPSTPGVPPTHITIGRDGIPRNPITLNPAPKPPDENVANFPATRLLWPTSGHVITQYYGWKHTGVDIDGDFTSPIYAAADGVVEKAGWNSGGYGLMVLIDHPNGMKTRYGHSSKLFVKAGDIVKKGEVISMMGTTGRSTGTHLHFEVYNNNVRGNPLAYIK
jgi:murein DD-endopeptidase MepM/ murein hydrolase activator NlpD